MRKHYEAPALFVDEFVADTMIASCETGDCKAVNGQGSAICAGCKTGGGLSIENGYYCSVTSDPAEFAMYDSWKTPNCK